MREDADLDFAVPELVDGTTLSNIPLFFAQPHQVPSLTLARVVALWRQVHSNYFLHFVMIVDIR